MGERLNLKLNKNILCPYYISGNCKCGSNCIYSHTPEEVLRKTTMCKFWLQKKCCNKQCHFAHGNEELKPQRVHYKLGNQVCKLKPIGISEKEYLKYGKHNNEIQNKQNEVFAISKKCIAEKGAKLKKEGINEKRIDHQMTNNFDKYKSNSGNNSTKKYNSYSASILKKKNYDGINNVAYNYNDNVNNNCNYNLCVENSTSHEFDNNNYKSNLRNNMSYNTKRKSKNFLNDNSKNYLETKNCTLNGMNGHVDFKYFDSHLYLNSSTNNLAMKDKIKTLNHRNSNKNLYELIQSSNFVAFPFSDFLPQVSNSVSSPVLQEKKNNEEIKIKDKERTKILKENWLQLQSLIEMLNSKKLINNNSNGDISNDKNNNVMDLDEFNLLKILICSGIGDASDNSNDGCGVNDIILQCLLKSNIENNMNTSVVSTFNDSYLNDNNNRNIDQKDHIIHSVNSNDDSFKIYDENTNMKSDSSLLNLMPVLFQNYGKVNEEPDQMNERTKEFPFFEAFQGTVFDFLAAERLNINNKRDNHIDNMHKNLLDTEKQEEQQERLQEENDEESKKLFKNKMEKELYENLKKVQYLLENKSTKEQNFLPNEKNLNKSSQSSLQQFCTEENHYKSSQTNYFNHIDKDCDNNINIKNNSDLAYMLKDLSAYIPEDFQVSINLKDHSDKVSGNINDNNSVLNEYKVILQNNYLDDSSISEYDLNKHNDVMAHDTTKYSIFNQNKPNINEVLQVLMDLAQNHCDQHGVKYQNHCFNSSKEIEIMPDILLPSLCNDLLNENKLTQQKKFSTL